MRGFQRSQVATLIERLSEPPERLIAVFGPRQTGKTTAARQALASVEHASRYVAVDDPGPQAPHGPLIGDVGVAAAYSGPRDVRWLTGLWEMSRRRAWRSDRGCVLVLDEIQKIPGWPDAVKGLWDADRAEGCPLHVVVLGSAPLLMQAGLNESLAGRFEPMRFTHWSYLEMSEAFGLDLDRYIYFGGYPGAVSYTHDQRRWSTYVRDGLVEPIIERDVLAMTRVDKPSLLKRLFEVGALYSGQVLSYNKMLGQLQDARNTTTLTRYLKLLSDAGLLTGLSKYTNRPVSARASTPKLNVLNTALMSVASGYGFEEARSDRAFWGRIVESAVGAHLLNTAAPGTEVRYWREGNYEVDFVLQRGKRAVAIEVKTGRVRSAHPGLAEFCHRFSPHRTLVVGTGGEPLHEFLSVAADHWFEPVLSAANPVLSKKIPREAYSSLSIPSTRKGLSIETMRERLRPHEPLMQELEDPRRPPPTPVSSAPSRHEAEMRQLRQQQQDEERLQREDWERYLRTHESELRENRFSPENLDKLAAVYFGWAGSDTGESGRDRIADFVGGDPCLVDLVMNALRDAIRRDDVPEVDTTLSLFSASRRPWLTFPVLASVDLFADDTQGLNGLDEERRRRALAIYYCFGSRNDAARACRGAWFQEDPGLALDVLSRCALAGLRMGDGILPGVYDLDLLEGHGDLVHDTRLRLLEAFPTQIPQQQFWPFDHLLGRTLEHGATDGLQVLAARKLALKSLSVSHQVRWMTVAALLSGGQRTDQLRTYLGENERRVRHLAEFLRNTCEDSGSRYPILARHRDTAMYADLIELLGRSYGPRVRGGLATVEISTSELIEHLISQLSAMADIEARQGLARLVDDPGLVRWRERLTRAQESQRVVYRDASYRHPAIKQVQNTLANRAPADAADLAALLRDQ